MSDLGMPAQTPPGWYSDPAGVLRWWDGTGWTQSTRGAAGQMPVTFERPRIPDDTPVDSAWVWVVALVGFVTVPLIFLFDVDAIVRAYAAVPGGGDLSGVVDATVAILVWTLVLSVVSLGVMALYVIAAFRDYKRLGSLGVQRPFHWAFAFLGPIVYLIGRHVVLRKVMRTPGWPLWVHIALQVITLIVVMVWTVWFVQALLTGIVVALGAMPLA